MKHVRMLGLFIVLAGCSGEDPEPAQSAGASGSAGTSGSAGASGSSAGQAGASGSSAGQAGASGSGGANIPTGCTPVPGGSPECSADKKKWYLQCPTAPVDCTKHPFVADTYCCQVLP